MLNNNRTARILPQDKNTQTWAPVCTDAGVLLSADFRGVPCPIIGALIDAHLATSPIATLAAIGHGVRLVTDGVTGHGGACFVEKRGGASGEVYVFGGASKGDALVALMGDGVQSFRVEAKGGLYVTLAPHADVGAFLKFVALHGSGRAPKGYLASMGAPQACDVVAMAPMVKVAIEPAAPAKGAKGKRAKRDAQA